MAFKYKKGTKYSGAKQSRYDSKPYTYVDKKGKTIKVDGLDDAICVNAWHVNSLGQMLKISAFQDDKTTIVEKYGKGLAMRWKVFNTVTLTKHFEYAIYNVSEGKANLKKCGLHIRTRSSGGGWCGTLSKKYSKEFYNKSKQGKNRS